MDTKKGDWVEIHNIIMEPSKHLYQDSEQSNTSSLQMSVKGYITHPADIGEMVEIETITGKKLRGFLISKNPLFPLGFNPGDPEIIKTYNEIYHFLHPIKKAQ